MSLHYAFKIYFVALESEYWIFNGQEIEIHFYNYLNKTPQEINHIRKKRNKKKMRYIGKHKYLQLYRKNTYTWTISILLIYEPQIIQNYRAPRATETASP